jgi:hypothetical protein
MTASTREASRAISRRSVIKGAAHVAWAVPAIQVVSAVPAFAASGCKIDVTGSATWRSGEANYIDVLLSITNSGTVAASSLTVTLTICDLEEITYNGREDYLPAGWTQAGDPNAPLEADGDGCYTLTYSTGTALPPNQTVTPKFTPKTQFYKGNKRPGGTISVTVTSPQCGADDAALVLAPLGNK